MTRIVIMGGGPAGYEAALVAAQHGADVTVVERDGMGGACVLDDCVPSKTLIASAGIRVELRRADELGVQVDRAGDGRRPAHGEQPRQGPGPGAVGRRPGAPRARGHPDHPRDRRASPASRRPGRRTSSRPRRPTGTTRSCPRTSCWSPPGRRPAILDDARPDGERILTWRQLYDLPELPEHLVVVGSGVTGAEFCSAYVEMGSEVTLVSSRDRVLPGEDADAAEVLQDVFADRGVHDHGAGPGGVRASASATAWSSRSRTGARSPARTR